MRAIGVITAGFLSGPASGWSCDRKRVEESKAGGALARDGGQSRELQLVSPAGCAESVLISETF